MYCRIRSLKENEIFSNEFIITENEKTIMIPLRQNSQFGYDKTCFNSSEWKTVHFSHIFKDFSTQEDVTIFKIFFSYFFRYFLK